MSRRLVANTLVPVLLIGAALAAYWPAMHAGFIWDDDRYIENNLLLQHPAGLWQMWFQIDAVHQFYPLTFTTFWLEYQAWGLNPLGYHIDNIILHALSAVLLWRLLLRVELKGAWAVALIFAVHPVEVESVAWATERKNVLSGLFYMLTLTVYFQTRWGQWILRESDNRRASDWIWYALSLILFACALMAKSVTSTLPAVILLLAYWKRGAIRRRDVLPLAPMFAAAIAMGSMTRWVETNIVGAVGPEFDSLRFFGRLCIAGRALWFYLFKIFWPRPLVFIYPRWQIEPWFIVFTVAALAALASLWLLRRRLGRGPLVAMLFFAGTLTPALGFINVFPMRYSFVADHFQYLACIGPIALSVAALWRFAPRPLAGGLCVMLAATLAYASNTRSRVYQNRQTLWSDTAAQNPDSSMVHANLGQVYLQGGDIDAAEAEFQQALKLLPQEPANYINIGYCYARRGNWPQAVRWYSEALDRSPDSPDRVIHRMRAQPYFQLGTAWGELASQALQPPSPDAALGRHYLDLAEGAYRNAIQVVPDYAIARENLGALLAAEDRTDEAIEQFREAIDISPDSLRAHEQLGDALLTQHKFDAASDEFQQMLIIDPDNSHAYINLGTVAAVQGKWDEAISSYATAVKKDPQNSIAHRLLRAALAKKQAASQ